MREKGDKKLQIRNSTAEFLMFAVDSNQDGVEVRFKDETVWLSQKMMAVLFDCSSDNISLHLKNIFQNQELVKNSVTEEFSATASDGKVYQTKHYNLDAIISVGYRINSKKATRFRQWATNILKEFAIKGFVIDQARLKNGAYLGRDYFDELLEIIREIRAVNGDFIRKLLTFTPQPLIMTLTVLKQNNFFQLSKINYILQLPTKRLPKLYLNEQTVMWPIWD